MWHKQLKYSKSQISFCTVLNEPHWKNSFKIHLNFRSTRAQMELKQVFHPCFRVFQIVTTCHTCHVGLFPFGHAWEIGPVLKSEWSTIILTSWKSRQILMHLDHSIGCNLLGTIGTVLWSTNIDRFQLLKLGIVHYMFQGKSNSWPKSLWKSPILATPRKSSSIMVT